jgi:chitodextrinase
MVADTATDDGNGLVQYQVERTVDGNFAGLTGWQTSRVFTDTSLLPDTPYCYRVRASDLCGNVTDWSGQLCASINPDVNAPTPNPMAWESPPATASDSSITMVAMTATDDRGGPVEYEFERTVNGSNAGSSGWQTSRVFTDTGLLAGEYCYRVRARDGSGNVTAWSIQGCVFITVDTNPPSPAPTIVFNPSVHMVTYDVCDLSGEFQFPYQYPDYDMTWWHKVVVNVAGIVDDGGGPVEIRFICNTHSSYNSNTRIPLAYRPILVGQGVQNTIGTKADGWRLTYNGDTIIYDVKTTQEGGIGVSETWTVCAYDELLNSVCSASHVIGP